MGGALADVRGSCRDVDDDAAHPAGDHSNRRFPGAEVGTPQIDGQHAIPLILIDVKQSIIGVDPRVVHPYVDSTQLGDCKICQGDD